MAQEENSTGADPDIVGDCLAALRGVHESLNADPLISVAEFRELSSMLDENVRMLEGMSSRPAGHAEVQSAELGALCQRIRILEKSADQSRPARKVAPPARRLRPVLVRIMSEIPEGPRSPDHHGFVIYEALRVAIWDLALNPEVEKPDEGKEWRDAKKIVASVLAHSADSGPADWQERILSIWMGTEDDRESGLSVPPSIDLAKLREDLREFREETRARFDSDNDLRERTVDALECGPPRRDVQEVD